MADSLIDTRRLSTDITKTVKRINAVLSKVKDPKKKREILLKASELIKDKARRLAPVGKPRGGVLSGAVSALYNSPKLIGGLRAPRGRGVIKARFQPQNLRLSIRALNLKNTSRVFIGPRVKKRLPKRVGTSERNANAFYTQMVYGSARAFQKNVMINALQSTKGRAAQIVASETRKELIREKKKQGL